MYSVESVAREIVAGADELSDWAAALDPAFFLATAPSDIPSLAAVSSWANSGGYDPAAISTFLQVADYYLVAQAHAARHIVVTHERPAATARRIKIPDACIGLGIKFLTFFEMLRTERARFVLGPSP